MEQRRSEVWEPSIPVPPRGADTERNDALAPVELVSDHDAMPRDTSEASRLNIVLPLVLFLLTCATTYLMGGLAFSAALMVTLLCHEFGHYLQARRYGVPASLPYFIPMPFSIIGTMGAVIAMHPGLGNRKSLFDIAVTGPLAGLVPALAFSAIGLSLSDVRPLAEHEKAIVLGEPLLFQWLSSWIVGPLAEGQEVFLHPLAYAGWVGVFITGLNLLPIGQLDGGHILYALLRQKAHVIATTLLAGAAVAVVVFGYWGWTLMLFLLALMGPRHPPTADDDVPLGLGRTYLGLASLLFVVVGFTPLPFSASS